MHPGKPLGSLLILLGFITAPVVGFAGEYNATTDEGKIVCVYPLSGQYGLLSRFLYYVLLIFAVFMHRQVWLIAGALASALTYSGTASIHAIVLAGLTRNESTLFDIDIVGTWAVLSAACVALFPVFEWSSTLRESQFRPIFGIWGMLCGIGAICALVAITPNYPTEIPCVGASCSRVCSSAASQILRSPAELVPMPEAAAFGTLSLLIVASAVITGVFGLGPAILAPALAAARRRTRVELENEIRKVEPEIEKLDRLLRRGFGSPKVSRAYRKRREEHNKRLSSARKELRTGQYDANRTCWSYLCFAAFPIVIILNEMYLLAQGGLPTSEQSYAIGQWGPWVSAALVLIAASINAKYEPHWREIQDTLTADQKLRNETGHRAKEEAMSEQRSQTVHIESPRGQNVMKNGVVTLGSSEAGQLANQLAMARLRRYQLDLATSTWKQNPDTRLSLDLEADWRASNAKVTRRMSVG